MRYYSKNDKEIMTLEEQEEIVTWVRDNYTKFKVTGFNRWRCILENAPSYPDCIDEIKERIIFKESLEDYQQEPLYKDAIGYQTDGGQLHEHIDKNVGDLIHVRFNVYVQLPYEGGYPVYGNNLYKLKERTYICCRAGIDHHYATQVRGTRERVILSFGFLMKKEQLGDVIYDY